MDSISALNLDHFEVIVVDSNSNDGTREYLSRMTGSDTRIRTALCDKRIGWSEANQIGLDLARGKWLCLSNPDIVFNRNFREMYEDCRENSDILAVAPQLVWPDGRKQWPAKTITPELSLWGHTRLGRWVLAKLGKTPTWQYRYRTDNIRLPVPFPQGSLFMVHRDVLALLKGHLWNKGYLNGVSDFDAFLNFAKHGVKIWLYPQVRMIHYGSHISKKSADWIERDQAYGFVLYFRYHPWLSNRISPRLYSILFGLESIVTIPFDVAGSIIKRSEWFNPTHSVWRAGQRWLGLVEGWRYPIGSDGTGR
jgi:GT2 family glycosyltransferase